MKYSEWLKQNLDPRTKHLARCLKGNKPWPKIKVDTTPFMTELGMMQYDNGSYRFTHCEYKGK